MTTAQPKPMTDNGCGGARGTTDFRLGAVGEVLVAPFLMPQESVSGRADVVLTGEIGARVRVRVATSQAFPTIDAGTPGVVVVEGAYTLAARNDAVAIGAGPCWVARYITVRVVVEALGPNGEAVSGTVELNVHDRPSAPFRSLGLGVVP